MTNNDNITYGPRRCGHGWEPKKLVFLIKMGIFLRKPNGSLVKMKWASGENEMALVKTKWPW